MFTIYRSPNEVDNQNAFYELNVYLHVWKTVL